jgi:hypothetical protein
MPSHFFPRLANADPINADMLAVFEEENSIVSATATDAETGGQLSLSASEMIVCIVRMSGGSMRIHIGAIRANQTYNADVGTDGREGLGKLFN